MTDSDKLATVKPKPAFPVRADDVRMVLDTVDAIVRARLQAGMMEHATTQRIRAIAATLRDDTERAGRGADLLERLAEHLNPEERSRLAAAVIETQLGRPDS